MRLGIGESKTFHLIETAGGGFKIAPRDPDCEKTMKIVEEVMDEYSDTLRALAKS